MLPTCLRRFLENSASLNVWSNHCKWIGLLLMHIIVSFFFFSDVLKELYFYVFSRACVCACVRVSLVPKGFWKASKCLEKKMHILFLFVLFSSWFSNVLEKSWVPWNECRLRFEWSTGIPVDTLKCLHCHYSLVAQCALELLFQCSVCSLCVLYDRTHRSSLWLISC